jgi:hypothetical protein
MEKRTIEHIMRVFVILLLVNLGLVPSIARADDADLELARKLIVSGRPAQAFDLLEPHEFDQAGNKDFDYLLGLAALNSGQAGKASIILERVLTVDPLFAAARVDLGRAYFLLGESAHARAEFMRARELNPPPPALATITEYLGTIEALNHRPPNRLSSYFEAGIGYSDNVNNSTSQVQIIVPALLGTVFTLNATNAKTADAYLGWAAGGEVVHPAVPDWSLYAGVVVHGRNDLKYSNFDYLSLDTQAGVDFHKNAEQIRGGLVAGQFDQAGMVNRTSRGINAEWRHTLNGNNQPVLFGQHILYRYPDAALASNNFDQTIAGLGWIHILANGRSTVFGSIFGGNEHDTNLRIDGGKRIQGIRLSGQASLQERLDLFASGGVQWGKFDRTNSAFLVARTDHQADLTVGLTYRYAPGWILRPQISLIRNQSNIVIDMTRPIFR